ncbi:uncharacterized protein LOC123311660 [Coccinella septempunctata]|uniref:uncharacterized protein LOC123311660 n=1 Tax=Coccinella septempunctata TaxID=41139 RepID=UPI001D0690D6|nr:uncharacterized protein LOC123311660 [Coccinella septempunctata]
MGFYEDVARTFGQAAVKNLEVWATTNTKLSHYRNRRVYLLQCKKHGIFPKHIGDNTKKLYTNLNMQSVGASAQVENMNVNLKLRILKLEIRLTIKYIGHLEKIISKHSAEAIASLPVSLVNEFQQRLKNSYDKEFRKIKNRNLKKFNNIKSDIIKSLKIKDSWLRNLTDVVVPDSVKSILSLGPKFAIKPSNNEISIKKLLAVAETAVQYAPTDQQNLIRAKITNIVTNYFYKNEGMSSVYNHLYLEARNFLKTNPELLVCRSDKGNVTVLITSAQYHEKVMELLNDSNVYEVLPRDPTSNIIRRNNDISKRLKELGYITPRECKNINTYKALPPNFYILIKVHKEGLPGRPIVSSINSPTTKLSAFITEVLKVSFSDYFTYSVKDSESFCQLVKNVQLPAGFVLISLDAVSLFTNITLQLVIQLLDDNWHMIAPNCNIPKDEFLAVITFLFSSNYFVYDGKFYKQKDGCPMGSNPSAILAIIVMTEIIRRACIVLGFTLPFICHYVDDIITAVPETEIDSVRQQFNLVFEDVVSFTVKRETNNAVPFLDTLVIRTPDNTLITDWYTKPASSGKFINFQSYHSFKVKTNFILGMKK